MSKLDFYNTFTTQKSWTSLAALICEKEHVVAKAYLYAAGVELEES